MKKSQRQNLDRKIIEVADPAVLISTAYVRDKTTEGQIWQGFLDVDMS